jgi:hypothetical protein
MDTKLKEKRLPRREVTKAKKKSWKVIRSLLGTETFYARLLIGKGVKTSTARNAVEGGLANEEVIKLIDEFCAEIAIKEASPKNS